MNRVKLKLFFCQLTNIMLSTNVIIIIFIIAFFVQSVYYLLIYIRVLYLESKEISNVEKPISVIISARNEAENLKKNLPKILNQAYDNFELIVINDRSKDDTENVLERLKELHHNLKVVNIDEASVTNAGKKSALTEGIKIAKNEHLVFTDADCYPSSKNWLAHIANAYAENTEIVLAYGGYEERKGLLNKLIRFDTLMIALQYMSFSLSGFPYMGVGRNLSFTKSCFLKNKGYESHLDVLSGDDDLFVNETATKKNTSIVIHKESVTRSKPKESIKEYINQKRRHLLTGKLYKTVHLFLLGTEILSRFLFYFAGLLCLISSSYFLLIFSFFIIRLFTQMIIIGFFSKRLNEKKVLIFIPIFDILIPIINLYIGISNIFIKDRDIVWK